MALHSHLWSIYLSQFFEPIKNGSPNKKRKLEQEEVDHSHTIDDTSDICRDHDQDHDEYEEAMPGFHEHDENDVEISLGDVDEDGEDVAQSLDKMLSRPRPPASAPARANPQQPFQQACATASTSATSVSRIISKPHSTSHTAGSSGLPSGLSITTTKQISGKDLESTHPTKRTRAAESHECPVCGKALQTDNHGLNTHIDFCLSRDAIREAQSEASSPADTKKDKVGMKQPIKWKGKR
jgi:DNA polymerase kappa